MDEQREKIVLTTLWPDVGWSLVGIKGVHPLFTKAFISSERRKKSKKNLAWPIHLLSRKLIDAVMNLIDHIWSIDQLTGLSS